MSCSTVFGCLSDKPISSREIEEMTNMKRAYISSCLVRFVKQGKVTKTQVDATNSLGPRKVYVYTLCTPLQDK
jgi:predicted transcriptional regulator